MLKPFSKVKLGIQPIGWINDDFHELGGKISLEQCLTEMRESGYRGTELGRKFPKDARTLKPLLAHYGLSLVSGWHSTHLLTQDTESENQAFLQHLDFLNQMGSPVIIVAECSHRTYSDPKLPLAHTAEGGLLAHSKSSTLTDGLNRFGEIAAKNGMKLVYHHHMGTVVETEEEIDFLLEHTDPSLVSLLGDTGHMAFAGMDPQKVFAKHQKRIGHVHLKNIRPDRVAAARKEKMSFYQAVKSGVFTVPGDGGIDYLPIFKTLQDIEYEGWWVVEAEQDPILADPLRYATMARKYIYQTTGV